MVSKKLVYTPTNTGHDAMSAPDGEPASRNIFVRFRRLVDSSFASAAHALLSLAPPPPSPSPLSSSSSPSPSAIMDDNHQPPSDQPFHDDDDNDALASLIASPNYSPLALRHLPPPAPRGLAPGLAPVLTFEDAFEDLLAVSRGQPLPDLRDRHAQRLLLRGIFPAGEPAWFWLRRLEAQRLIPPARRRRPDHHPFFFPPPATGSDSWDALHGELQRLAAAAWRPPTTAEAGPDDDFFLHRPARPTASPAQDHHHHHHHARDVDRYDEPAPDHGQPPRPAPNTFDDLFSSLSSAFAEGQRSWDALMSIIAKHPAAAAGRPAPTREEHVGRLGCQHTTRDATQETREEDVDPLGRQHTAPDATHETREEHVDRLGYRHTTVTRNILDSDGRQVGRETFVTVRPDGDDEPGQRPREGAAGKRSGWFWK